MYRISTLTDQVELAEKEVQRISIQYKNSQEDLNFAQMCVKNLQASLAVYSTITTKEEERSKLTHPVSIMDEELCKLRQLVIEEVILLKISLL